MSVKIVNVSISFGRSVAVGVSDSPATIVIPDPPPTQSNELLDDNARLYSTGILNKNSNIWSTEWL